MPYSERVLRITDRSREGEDARSLKIILGVLGTREMRFLER